MPQVAGLNWEPRILESRDSGQVELERAAWLRKGVPLVVHRWKGTSAAAPLIFLCGGPGESAIAYLKHPPFRDGLRQMAGDRDLILLEQRGCGEADPDFRVDALDSVDFSLAPDYEKVRDSIRAQLLSSGRDLAAYNVLESAQDVEALIDHLGVRACLLAHSYGTHLAQFVLKRCPEKIERVVLLGFEGPDQTWKFAHQATDQLERLAGRLNLDLSAWAEALPDRVTVEGREVHRFWILQMIAGWSSLSNRWRDLAQLPMDLDSAWPKFRKGWIRPAVFFLNDEASGASELRWEQIQQDATGWAEALNFPFPLLLGLPQLSGEDRNPLSSKVQMLILTGELDGFTPSANVALATLPNARHHELEGAAHNDLLAAPEGVRLVTEFLSP